MRPPIPYYGGKQKQARILVQLVPSNHVIFAEVFAGSAAMTFAKAPSTTEVLNDINLNLVSFFRVLKDRSPEFREKIKWMPPSRDLNEEMRRVLCLGGSELERAVALYYVLQTSFSAEEEAPIKVLSGPKGNCYTLDTEGRSIERIRKRLSKVFIENLDFREFIGKYDRPETMLFLDPPYKDLDASRYAYRFSQKDHEDLAALLRTVKGRFILTYDDCTWIREAYKQFQFPVTFEHKKNADPSKKGGVKNTFREVVISNFDPDRVRFPLFAKVGEKYAERIVSIDGDPGAEEIPDGGGIPETSGSLEA